MRNLFLGICFVAALCVAQAAPTSPDQLELRRTINLAVDAGVAGNSIFNPRYFDGDVFANQINVPAFGRYAAGSTVPTFVTSGMQEHRMVAPFRGANSTFYILGASGATTTTLTRYDASGLNPVEVAVPGEAQTTEGFDWVDENTVIYTTYNPSANRRRLSLAHVEAEPFAVTVDTRWNGSGFVATSASTRIRNVRVGDQYSGHAYYGDAGQNDNPAFYAINLATGAETLLGRAGQLTGGGSFGVWTVVERDGFLYVQTTDNGIQIYEMPTATSVGPLLMTYTKERLDELTGYTGQYYGLDVSADGSKLLLGGAQGAVYELAPIPRVRLTTTFNLPADAGIGGSSIFNSRLFDGDVYVNQINTPGFGRYPLGSAVPSLAVASLQEHRMVAPFRGENRTNYIFGASGAATTVFSRYDFNGENQVDVAVPGDSQTSEGFDWVDENTIIYTTYNPSSGRRNLSLARVVAEPFSVVPDPRWNVNGFVTTSASTRIRNVRVGDQYNGFAYYGDAGQNTNPNFYAINLATGAETLLGNAGTLTGAGSFGLWTVVERGGLLYVHTTDNGVQVYNMNSATSLGSLVTTYSKAELDEATGYTGQYWGFDVSGDGQTFILGGAPGLTWELTLTSEGTFEIGIARVGNNVVLSWPLALPDAVVETSGTLSPPQFTAMDPQPTVVPTADQNTATVPISESAAFFRIVTE
jgi:hypothetical protein